ncbi:zinc-alpha-2-glycoprotein-like [Gracilinanus agilis]|uniref:zinc-alpha-2-glycoprotein-like n=1 Tax=Gracilinanus agilis TaxID=191870 RepID=UPI001CFE9E09|nr:zinc-alpha-2-glycoprotein-like [Gracilinanus agilis]
MMEPLVTAIFLFLLSRTIMPQYSRGWYDSLVYKDIVISNHQNGYYSLKNEAYFNGQSVYIYDNSSKREVPQPRWQNVENWDEVSQFQKEREDFIMKDLQEIRNSNEGTFTFTLNIVCECYQYEPLRVIQYFNIEGDKFINTNKNMLVQASQDSAAEMIKQQLKQDQSALNLLNVYLEKTMWCNTPKI